MSVFFSPIASIINNSVRHCIKIGYISLFSLLLLLLLLQNLYSAQIQASSSQNLVFTTVHRLQQPVKKQPAYRHIKVVHLFMPIFGWQSCKRIISLVFFTHSVDDVHGLDEQSDKSVNNYYPKDACDAACNHWGLCAHVVYTYTVYDGLRITSHRMLERALKLWISYCDSDKSSTHHL